MPDAADLKEVKGQLFTSKEKNLIPNYIILKPEIMYKKINEALLQN